MATRVTKGGKNPPVTKTNGKSEGTGKEVALRPSQAIAGWEEEFAASANKSAEAVKDIGGGLFISIRGNKFSMGDEELDSPLVAVVAGVMAENAYYTRAFDPSHPENPVCFALGTDAETLVPHDLSTEKQAESCAKCPMNAFGSASTGKGKACKNSRRLALLSADGLSADSELMQLKLPPTSLKAFGKYVKKVTGAVGRGLEYVVTELHMKDDATYPMVEPQFAGTINDPKLLALIRDTFVPAAMRLLAKPFEPREATEEAAAPAKKAAPAATAKKRKF